MEVLRGVWREESGVFDFDLNVNDEATQQFFYGKMLGLTSFEHTFSDLIELGFSMHGTSKPNTDLPAGYVFLGQFIDHDLSRDLEGHIFPPEVEIDPATRENGREPFFNLDSLYGKGPSEETDKVLYENGTCFLKLSPTEISIISDIDREFQNDLPRKTGDTIALIKDGRNDENLAVAQTQVAFIKFHNAVVKLLDRNGSVGVFEAARKIVTQHYQWIVLNDFLPRIIQTDVLKRVLEGSVQLFYNPDPSTPFMPVEFSVAAYRLGHSMVPRDYQWNRIFKGSDPLANNKIIDLFTNTGRGNLGTQSKTLSGRWIIDWRRFYDFTVLGVPRPESTFALGIDTMMPFEFKNLPLEPGPGEIHRLSLPVRNLYRGRRVGLPAGQDVAELFGVGAIAPAVMAAKLPLNLRNKFAEKTPLWYYILAEAEEMEEGKRLGPVGSRIVAEVFVKLLKLSPHSILGEEFTEQKWQSDLMQDDRKDKFEMVDILRFICQQSRLGDVELNPIG